jgi:hypothetical protein
MKCLLIIIGLLAIPSAGWAKPNYIYLITDQRDKVKIAQDETDAAAYLMSDKGKFATVVRCRPVPVVLEVKPKFKAIKARSNNEKSTR